MKNSPEINTRNVVVRQPLAMHTTVMSSTFDSPQMAPVLFLDFDGVTHPEPCRPNAEFCRLGVIEDTLREFPMLEVVISSSWRVEFSLGQLRQNFSADFAHRVVGVTPDRRKPSAAWLPGGAVHYEREAEIEAWMKANRPWGTPWIALDDRPNWFRPGCRDLLVTDKAHGFHLDQVETLREMIRERIG